MENYLQFVSDIHLEFYKKSFPTIEPIKDPNEGNCFLALLVDIGYPHHPNYENFIAHHCKIFKEIFIVAGNHEYYSSKNKQHTISDIETKIEQVCAKFVNVTFLNNSSKIVNRTLFLGSTL